MSEFIHKINSLTSDHGPESTVPHLQEYDLHSHRSNLSHVNYRADTHIEGVLDTSVPEYHEHNVTVVDWFKKVFADPLGKVKFYLTSLFPILQWIFHYNIKWLYGDLVAGITVGVVLVPQSMSYAQLAGLPAEYGLYSSFVGVFIYSFFATSKDVSIGPVAVMSMQVGKVIAKVVAKTGDKYSPPEIATFLSLICGGIATGIGILRLGFILEFISIPAVMGFMSGSAFSIIVGQVPALMGYNSLVNTRDASYKVVVNTLKNLGHTKLDAAFGLVPLFILYVWKYGCDFGQKRYPKAKLVFFYIQQLRNAIVIIVATAISWGVVHPKKKAFHGKGKFKPPISVIGTVPRGLKHTGVMTVPDGIINDMALEIPVSVIILLLEHIAISKSFGRVNDYKVIPDQEVIAIGVNNLIGTFFNAYPATGSFSRSALKAKCGVRTPLAGIFTGCVVLLALYALTSTFYYIPKATLSAVIIHAVSDLIANYKVTWNFWNISPLDAGIFIIAVIITVFALIEDGVYFAICASAAVLLFRVAIPKGQFLGRIQVAEVVNPVINNSRAYSVGGDKEISEEDSQSSQDIEIHKVLSNSPLGKSKADYTSGLKITAVSTQQLIQNNPNVRFHTRWVPLDNDNINERLNVRPPPPGVIVFRPVEAFVYPNSSRQVDRISDEAKLLTKRGIPYSGKDAGSRPWNDPGPLRWNLPFFKKKHDDDSYEEEDTRPPLRIVHLDFSAVSLIDVTSIQALVDLRKALNRYADREVEFHFSGIMSPWIRRGLLKAGFGAYEDDGLVSGTTYVNIAASEDLESGSLDSGYFAAVGTDTPFFHFEIPDYR